MVDLVQNYVKQKGGTRKGILTRYDAIRSFFLNNRVPLPQDHWDPGRGTREPTRGKLNVGAIRRIVYAASPRDKAIFLTLFQSTMDLERFDEFNRKYAELLTIHLKKTGGKKPFRVDFMRGRKSNRKPFYTFLGSEALQAWKDYFGERGWPKKEEPLAIVPRTKKPISKAGIRVAFDIIAYRYGLKSNGSARDYGFRSGVNPHEIRDVVRSHLQQAKGDGLDETCVEFWMGHTVDPSNYNKFAELNPDYVFHQYSIAEKYLSLLKPPPNEEVKRQEEELKKVQERLANLEKVFTEKLKIKEN